MAAEGCSSVHFERLMGQEAAERMLLRGEKISAAEAFNIGLVTEVVDGLSSDRTATDEVEEIENDSESEFDGYEEQESRL